MLRLEVILGLKLPIHALQSSHVLGFSVGGAMAVRRASRRPQWLPGTGAADVRLTPFL